MALKNRVAELEKEKKELMLSAQEAEIQTKEAIQQRSDLDNELSVVGNECQKLRDELSILKSTVESLHTEAKEKEVQISALKEEARKEQIQHSAEMKRLASEIGVLKDKVEEEREEHDKKLTAAKRGYEEHISQFRSVNQTLEEQLKVEEDRGGKHASDVANLNARLKEAVESNMLLEKEVAKLKQVNKDSKKYFEKVQAEAAKLAEHEHRCIEQEKEISELQAEAAKLAECARRCAE
eukprot:CAMPEP_0113901100 /NCGR_PEP_ID=MMETSP0780_2-20120614/21058_1 /TAXON_ID=652834 /ORGANISM="Palpitomonas bilix" /LENGTH=237 /DNA_ID=CAMNT_0000893659 /DNA_START=384 /DNA_END=1094 /DNA_ORIENTATION=+ /assembly_acc=CAM_ASM_000599